MNVSCASNLILPGEFLSFKFVPRQSNLEARGCIGLPSRSLNSDVLTTASFRNYRCDELVLVLRVSFLVCYAYKALCVIRLSSPIQH